jgi:ABC-type phosphate/phosphonate transport system substrate-binding protein
MPVFFISGASVIKSRLPQQAAYCIILTWLKTAQGEEQHAFQLLVMEKNMTIHVFCYFLFLSPGVHAGPPLKLGIHTYLSSTEIERRFTPLADYLSRELKRPVTLEIASSYAEHIRNLGTESVDVALLGPVSYVLMTREYGRRPLLAVFESNGTKTFRNAIITKKGSHITSLSQFKGKNSPVETRDLPWAISCRGVCC